jgi:predicted nuclease of predicted toxin-antitoxin system
MKVLIDEQLPTKLKFRFVNSGHQVLTVRDMDWLGKKNGELLRLIRENDFNVLLTNDKNMYYQQNMSTLRISILNVNAKTNRYQDVLEKIDLIKDKLNEIERLLLDSVYDYFIIE